VNCEFSARTYKPERGINTKIVSHFWLYRDTDSLQGLNRSCQSVSPLHAYGVSSQAKQTESAKSQGKWPVRQWHTIGVRRTWAEDRRRRPVGQLRQPQTCRRLAAEQIGVLVTDDRRQNTGTTCYPRPAIVFRSHATLSFLSLYHNSARQVLLPERQKWGRLCPDVFQKCLPFWGNAYWVRYWKSCCKATETQTPPVTATFTIIIIIIIMTAQITLHLLLWAVAASVRIISHMKTHT